MKKRYRSLRDYLRDTETTQAQFAAVVGTTQTHISQILLGLKNPSIGLALKIEQVTGITPRDLMASTTEAA